MTDAVLVGLIAAVPATVAAFASWRNGRKADVAAGKIAEIHVLTNSNLTAVKTDLALANSHIAELQMLVNKLIESGHSSVTT